MKRENLRIVLRVLFEILSFATTSILLVLHFMGVISDTIKIPQLLKLTSFLHLTGVISDTIKMQFLEIVCFLIFAILVSKHIFFLHRQLTPRLELVFDSFPSCRHDFLFQGRAATLFRVGLINHGGKTIENVRVSLEYIEPQGITFVPVRLRFMHERRPDEEFGLHPGKIPSLFVDVITDVRSGESTESIQQRIFILQYAVDGIPNVLQPDKYRLTLLAEGRDVQPDRKSFLVSWDGEQMGFQESGVSPD
jgi:hypothetical protein